MENITNSSNLSESSLSRVFKHFNDPDTTIVIFTAFRDGVPRKVSVQKNQKFATKLRNEGFGYFFVDGYFPENEGTEDEVQVSEDSIFAIADRNNSRKLIDLCHKLAKEENQDSIIVKELDKGIYFLDSSGKKHPIFNKNKITFKEVGKFYTKLRGKGEGNLFVFEGTHTRPGFIQSFREYIENTRKTRKTRESKGINESSLSRIYSQTLKHDSGTISAFRSARDCNDGEPFTKKENKKRSSILKAKLLKKGFGVTAIDGTYIENFKSKNQKEVKEDSFLVIDLKDTGKLKETLIALGQEFEQDSITFQDHLTGKYYLISSNTCKNGYPGFGKVGKEVLLGKPIFGKDGEFHSKINGRPFVFESIKQEVKELSDFYPTEIRSILALSDLGDLGEEE